MLITISRAAQTPRSRIRKNFAQTLLHKMVQEDELSGATFRALIRSVLQVFLTDVGLPVREACDTEDRSFA